MRERPILMTPEHAQKCHDGTKTQTRRVVAEKPPYLYVEPQYDDRGAVVISVDRDTGGYAEYWPYGGVGDRLWVRESIYIDHFDYVKGPLPKEKPSLDDGMLIYRGEGTCCEQFGECDCGGAGAPWRPSIHMPRWACRTVLEITEVRVERLKRITPADALAEGVFCPEVGYAQYGERAPVLLYGFLWESINGAGSWALNPWVWVIAFRKVGA